MNMGATITVYRRTLSSKIIFKTNVLFASAFEKALQDGDGESLEHMIGKIKMLHDYKPESEDSFVSEPHIHTTVQWDGTCDVGRPLYCVARTCITAYEFVDQDGEASGHLCWVPEIDQRIGAWQKAYLEAHRELVLNTRD
jgi:hypothetical protein